MMLMNTLFRNLALPSTSYRVLQVCRPLSNTSLCYAAKRRTRKKEREEIHVKHQKKVELPVVQVWMGITIRDLANQMNVDVERIFECILDTDYADAYTSPKQPLVDPHLISSILSMNKKRAGFVGAPSTRVRDFVNEDKLDIDVYPRPPPSPSVCIRRPPVVTIMGHVDHGKTTLLDSLRKSRIVDSEFGGITQHIGAFSVRLPLTGATITFLDTPGHAAFHEIRKRGANATDLVVLVVAADDGVMDQTRESIEYARSANVPILVAINKIDKYNADIQRTKENLLAEGLVLEEYQGDVQAVCISALEGTNLDLLQETIITQAELLDIKADYNGLVEGVVIEASQEKGKGKVCTSLVQRGSLKKGDYLVAGGAWCKVRALFDELDTQLNKATPGQAVQVTGWRDDLPVAGDILLQVENERRAREVIHFRGQKAMDRKAERDAEAIEGQREQERQEYVEKREAKLKEGFRRKFRDPLYYKKLSAAVPDEVVPTLAVLLKADVTSSLEAIDDVLSTFASHTIRLDIIDEGIGPPTINDVLMAKEFKGSIVTFNVTIASEVHMEADREGVKIQEYNVIYRLVDAFKEQLSSLLPLKEEEKVLGEVDVVKVFQIRIKNKNVSVAGSVCNKGHIDKKERFRVIRGTHLVHDGPVKTMKMEKSEVSSANLGQEIGILLEDQNVEFEVGDRIVCYSVKQIPQIIDWHPPGF